jgi:salicylate synthetase
MSIKERGSVDHLGSSVHGQLSPNADSWAAFNVLFPSITASGIPKDIALNAIDHLETRPRELYSGAVLLIDPKEDFFEATLCLRIVLQDSTNSWIQAGAGIIAQSNPDREFTETNEKLASVAPYIVFKGKGGKKPVLNV